MHKEQVVINKTLKSKDKNDNKSIINNNSLGIDKDKLQVYEITKNITNEKDKNKIN